VTSQRCCKKVYTDFALKTSSTRRLHAQARINILTRMDKAEAAFIESLGEPVGLWSNEEVPGAFMAQARITQFSKMPLAASGSAERFRSIFRCLSGWTLEYGREKTARATGPSYAASTATLQPGVIYRLLIEEHAGASTWLAPVCRFRCSISPILADYAREVAKTFKNQGLRSTWTCATRK
jgi:hypothetical protein